MHIQLDCTKRFGPPVATDGIGTARKRAHVCLFVNPEAVLVAAVRVCERRILKVGETGWMTAWRVSARWRAAPGGGPAATQHADRYVLLALDSMRRSCMGRA